MLQRASLRALSAACPVDAIIGARQFLHTVLDAECNGCELCLAACPVDCIVMQPVRDESVPNAADNRRRYDNHRQREARLLREREALLSSRKQAARRGPAMNRQRCRQIFIHLRAATAIAQRAAVRHTVSIADRGDPFGAGD